MMSSAWTLRLNRRRAFSNDSPSCSRISAKSITLRKNFCHCRARIFEEKTADENQFQTRPLAPQRGRAVPACHPRVLAVFPACANSYVPLSPVASAALVVLSDACLMLNRFFQACSSHNRWVNCVSKYLAALHHSCFFGKCLGNDTSRAVFLFNTATASDSRDSNCIQRLWVACSESIPGVRSVSSRKYRQPSSRSCGLWVPSSSAMAWTALSLPRITRTTPAET